MLRFCPTKCMKFHFGTIRNLAISFQYGLASSKSSKSCFRQLPYHKNAHKSHKSRFRQLPILKILESCPPDKGDLGGYPDSDELAIRAFADAHYQPSETFSKEVFW